MIARESFPVIVVDLLAVALEAGILDALDLYALGREHGLDWLGLAESLAMLERQRTGSPGPVAAAASRILFLARGGGAG